jgi:hypothetical protein
MGRRLVDTDFHRPLILGNVPADVSPELTGAVIGELRRRAAAITGDDRSLADVVDAMCRDPLPWSAGVVRAVVAGEVEADTGAPLAQLSAQFGFEPGVGEGDSWVVGGYGAIVDHLLRGVDVVLDAPVTRVEWRDGGVSVTIEDRGSAAFDADAAVVTVPAAVLAAGAPEFVPPLPAPHRGALDRLTVGRVEKAALVFAERWWPVSPSSYFRVFGPAPGDVSEWLDVTDVLGAPALAGLFVGPWLDRLWSSPDDAEVAQAVSAALAAAIRAEPGWRGR